MLEYALLFMVGLVFGSFYNVLVYRTPRGMSIIPPSRCPHCGAYVRWFDNVPIISYLVLFGRCRRCGAKISVRYPLVEASTGVLAVLCKFKLEKWADAIVFFAFFSLLLVVSLIEWDKLAVPDRLVLGGLVFGLLTAPVRTGFSFVESLIGILTGVGIFLAIYLYAKIRKTETISFKNMKLIAFIGSVLGPLGVLYATIVGSVLGVLYLFPIAIKNKNFQLAIPFTPFLSLGAFVVTFAK